MILTTSTVLNGVPVASTIGYGTVEGHQGYRKQLGKMSASSAGHLRSDMSDASTLDFAQMNVEIGRPGFQLPIAPNSSRARKTRSQVEIGKTESRDAIPALGLDHKDFQVDGEARRLEQPMRFIGFVIRDR